MQKPRSGHTSICLVQSQAVAKEEKECTVLKYISVISNILKCNTFLKILLLSKYLVMLNSVFQRIEYLIQQCI